MENHIILCGLGRVGWRVLEYLQAANLPVAVIDNRCAAGDPRLGQATLVSGDCRRQETLERAGVTKARGVLILTSDDLVSISTALMVRHLNPHVRIVVRMFNQNLIARLGSAVRNVFALSTSALAAPLLAVIARTGEALGTFRLENDDQRQIAELTIAPHATLAGQTIADAARQHRFQPVAFVPAPAGPADAEREQRLAACRFFHDIDPETRLGKDDTLVVCGEPARLGPLLAQEENVSLPELLWAGFVRRISRVLWRTLAQIDVPVKICTSILLVVIFTSVLVFHFGMEKDTLVDAFYRTISLIATGADMGGRDLPEGGWQRAYVSALRLVGMALVAAFTAIFTNYLVRAQLGGALEVRRLPDGGHLIVCGLGNVGFRVVQELIEQGEPVVAIERNRDNAYIPTARRLGAAVIIGDVTVAEVLRQAHAPRARAVVAATDNELVNLEVALLARELKPKMRVVLRLTDPHLARTLREAADVRLALSIPELAAPAFIAALFGDRVRSVFFVQGRLLAAVDLVVQAGDEFLEGQSTRALAYDFQLLPVAILSDDPSADPSARHKSLDAADADRRLQAGDRLTVILALSDLQRLLQREKPPRDCGIEVTECPPTARAYVAQLLASVQALSAESTEKSLEQLPARLGNSLTRGQAEVLVELLRRERVVGKVAKT